MTSRRIGAVSPLRASAVAMVSAAALAGAWSAAREARFAYLRISNPERAYAERPDDAEAMGRALERRIRENRGSTITAKDVENGLRGLRVSPLSDDVLTVLGTKADLAGQNAVADANMAMANRLSRRDLITQTWLIERAVSRNDIAAALSHYDAALSVHPGIGTVLYPILVGALSEPEIRKALSPYLARQAVWAINLVDAAAASGNPRDLALLLLENADNLYLPSIEANIATLITKLVQAGELRLAEQVASKLVPRFNARDIRTLQVSDQTRDPRIGGLAWTFAQGGGIDTTVADGANGFDVSIAPLARGLAAERTIFVRDRAAYTFSYSIRGEAGSSGASGRWRIVCVPAHGDAPLLEQSLRVTSDPRRDEVRVEVPTACLALQFTLEVRGEEGTQASAFAIRGLSFRPE